MPPGLTLGMDKLQKSSDKGQEEYGTTETCDGTTETCDLLFALQGYLLEGQVRKGGAQGVTGGMGNLCVQLSRETGPRQRGLHGGCV